MNQVAKIESGKERVTNVATKTRKT